MQRVRQVLVGIEVLIRHFMGIAKTSGEIDDLCDPLRVVIAGHVTRLTGMQPAHIRKCDLHDWLRPLGCVAMVVWR